MYNIYLSKFILDRLSYNLILNLMKENFYQNLSASMICCFLKLMTIISILANELSSNNT